MKYTPGKAPPRVLGSSSPSAPPRADALERRTSETTEAMEKGTTHIDRWKEQLAFHVVLPLVLGVAVYVAWRTTDVVLVTWLPNAVVHALRATIGAVPLPRVVVASAPDLAWAWAFGSTLALVWRGRPARLKAPWLAAGALVAAFAEIGQRWGVPPGTFDIVDLLAILAGYALGATVASRARGVRYAARRTVSRT